MNEFDVQILTAYAENSMNATETAKRLHCNRNTVIYHFNKVKEETGLDPQKFYDLLNLLSMRPDGLSVGI